MARGVGGKSPANLQKYLRGCRHPADKRELIETAQENNAPDEIMDLLWKFPDEEFGGPQEVQQAYGEMEDGFSQRGSRQRSRGHDEDDGGRQPQRGGKDYEEDPEEVILAFLEEEGEADSFIISRMFNRMGIREPASRILSQMVKRGELEKTSDDTYALPRRGRSRAQQHDEEAVERGRSKQQSVRGGGDDPDPSQVSSRKRRSDEELEEARQAYEERKRRRQREQEEDDAEWDRRLKGHETDAISDARHMRHGYDGRGRVTDEESDRRLKDNETEALSDARHMRHGYDGRGRVRKLGPGRVDESIADDRDRYEDRKRREEGEVEPDPETGARSRRRKDDQGRTISERETWEERYGEKVR